MEKEIWIESDNFEINFFYDDFDLTEEEIESFQHAIRCMLSGLEWFKNTELRDLENIYVLNMNLVNTESIHELNKEHRNKDKITDVLSFPLQESLREGDIDSFNNQVELGDLFICRSVCEKQAEEFKLTFIEEFIHLSVHGFLHLCGYDHEVSPEEEKIMEGFEEDIIKHIVLTP